MFRIKKVLNVNVVLAEQDGHEYIAFGKGIGYRQKVNACLPDNAIFKKFMPLDDSRKSEMIQSLNNIPPVYISITSQIVTYAEQQLQLSLLPSIYYALTDHLAFSVQRYHSKQSLGNRIYWEMKTYYPEMGKNVNGPDKNCPVLPNAYDCHLNSRIIRSSISV